MMPGKQITANGKTQTAKDWAKELGLTRSRIYALAQHGELEERAKKGYQENRQRKAWTAGETYERLTILEDVDKDTIRVRCVCGNEKLINKANWGKSRSCGCYQKEKASQLNCKDLTGMTFGDLKVIRKVGSSKRGYVLWEVEAPNGKRATIESSRLISGAYKGKSLKRNFEPPENELGYICNRFKFYYDFESWEAFEQWAIDNGWPGTLMRKDSNLPHSKDNSFFVEGPMGISRGRIYVTVDGRTATPAQWAAELGISRQRVDQLLKKGNFERYVMNGPINPLKRQEEAKERVMEAIEYAPLSAKSIKSISGYAGDVFKTKVVEPLLEEGKIEPMLSYRNRTSIKQVYKKA